VDQGNLPKYFNTNIFKKTGLVHETIHDGLQALNAGAIYLLYGPLSFTLDAADSAESYSAIPQILFGCPTLLSKSTHEDKGPFGSGRPSFALFSKYLNSAVTSYIVISLLYTFLHTCHTYS